MLTKYMRFSYLFFLLCLFTSSANAEIYKWKKNGIVTYSQQKPINQDFEIISAPPPPSIDPNVAQKEIETLIEQQNGTFEQKEEERRLAKEAAAEKEKQKEYCRVNRHNLEQYQNNPGRRMMDADGNIIAPDENQRQKKIAELKKRLADHCQNIKE